ncbi:glycine cleavage system H protein [Novimethylophilus kurashikiensis]|uniref:Glycine cleavage system H protein n=1 Tax=Novimethylophilus kurashikiensis TaxID=1825523 RepID=A0A2R5F888_9PROT|nr:glycine cleavage system protein GcvH [Novimethylophilus kurashikiensis]GBG12844.1 glycine cleavage system H protein [Novimethylophilus kurashikiensis]
MNIPAELRYAATHEWVRQESDGNLTVGITDHAQEQLGDLVFIELPQVGKAYGAGQQIAVVESVKAASDIYAPVAGTVVEVNQAAADAPESVNDGAFTAWLFRIKPDNAADVQTLLDAEGYRKSVEG